MVVIKKSARFPFEKNSPNCTKSSPLIFSLKLLCFMRYAGFFLRLIQECLRFFFFTTVICIIDFIEFVSQIVVLLLCQLITEQAMRETERQTDTQHQPQRQASTITSQKVLSAVIDTCHLSYNVLWCTCHKRRQQHQQNQGNQHRVETNAYSVASKGELIDFQTCFTLHSKCLAVNL